MYLLFNRNNIIKYNYCLINHRIYRINGFSNKYFDNHQ